MRVWSLHCVTDPPDDVDVNAVATAAARRDLVEELRSVALASGLDRFGVCDAAVLERARRELHRRKSEGLSDTMQFTFRNPDRSTDPSATLPGAQSIFVAARSYHLASGSLDDAPHRVRDHVPVGERTSSHLGARVARYAQWDHYAMLRAGLTAVADVLKRAGHRAIVVADENNLVDREVAWKAGLGWFGKNANLLLPGAGSWFVLGSVITDADLGSVDEPVPDGCGSCRKCIDACPTGAIVADGVIDARRCLAWLVQKPGMFPREFRIDLGDRLYGCDDCQDSCPVTVRLGARRTVEPFESDGFVGAEADVLDILEADDDDLLQSFGRWYIPERNPVWVRRNALIILGNVSPIPVSSRTARVVDACSRSDDRFLRAHAVWVAHRLGLDDIVRRLEKDDDALVREECAARVRIPRRSELGPSAGDRG